MPDWAIWIIVAVALAAGEIFTLGFFLGPVALAAGLAAVIAAVGGGIAFQLVAFIAGSLASLFVLRPIAVRHLKTPKALRTGTAALVGARGTVLERVDDLGGQVKIGGEVWTARAMFEGHVIEPGTRVEVGK